MKYKIMRSELLDAAEKGNKRVGIYGISIDTVVFLNKLDDELKYITALYDEDPAKIGMKICGLTVEMLPQEPAEILQKADILLIGIFKNRHLIAPKAIRLMSGGVETSFFRSKLFFINSMPKSGSVFLQNTFTSHFNTEFIRSGGGRFPNVELVEIFATMPTLFFPSEKSAYLMQEHVSPSEFNTNLIFCTAKKMVLHVRDPRQAILSLYHHFKEMLHVYKLGQTYFPANYSSMTTDEQLGWVIEDNGAKYAEWLKGWMEIYKSEKYDILLTTHNQLKHIPDKLFENIERFYGFEGRIEHKKDKIDYPNLHFRKGEEDEWKHVLPLHLQQKLSSYFTDEMIDFCYTPFTEYTQKA